MEEKQKLIDRLKVVEHKKEELRFKIIDKYFARLKGILASGLTGNIQINAMDGFPMNHNVNYTISLTYDEKEYIDKMIKEEKYLETEAKKQGVKTIKEG